LQVYKAASTIKTIQASLFKTTLNKKTFVLTLNERSGTVLLLDVLTQLRRVEASRVDEDADEENNGITLQGATKDIGNPNISFCKSSGQRR
jgi:hypothetical protein